MKNFLGLCVLFIFSLFSATNFCIAAPAPKVIRESKLFKVSDKVKGILSNNDQTKDGIVRPSEKFLLSADLSDKEILVGLYQELESAGLAFDGTIFLPPQMNYLQFMQNSAGWLASDVNSEKFNARARERLLSIINTNYKMDPILTSYGFILAAIVAPQDFARELSPLLSEDVVKGFNSPFIIHNASSAFIILSAKNADSIELSQRLSTLLLRVKGEEEREDLISALSLSADQSGSQAVFSFLDKFPNGHSDLDYETAILAFRSRMKPEAFDEFYNGLTKSRPDKKTIASLNQFKSNNFKYGMTSESGMLKAWDQCKIAVYDDGLFVSIGKFSNFHPNR